MNHAGVTPRITLRIPGAWSHPGELMERLPEGVRLSPENLWLPDGTEFEINPLPPDGQFPEIFESSCRRTPTDAELDIVSRYTVNIGLVGDGGSLDAARATMRAAAAIVQAGGAGVFIDNCALAHGGETWMEMADDGGPDALSFAFTSLVRSKSEVYSMGLHALGFPDLLMRADDVDEEGRTIIEIVRYVCEAERTIDVGHILADEQGPRFHVVERVSDEFDPDSPLHNPYGRLKLVSLQEIAEGN
ncbi:MAG: hypothetical protein JNG89_18505 [Planctomycetaceae bacterium]|nr:hypothetical protein [Planctomycetaceae bacterium]